MARKPAKTRPRTRLETDARRAQLLGLGIQLFANRAYDEVSIEDLAAQAGVSKGLVYHYFPTKRDLYVTGLREAAAQLVARTTGKWPELRPIDQMRRSMEALLEYVQEHAQAYSALMRGGIGSDPEVAEIVEGVRTVYVDRLLDDVYGLPMPGAPRETPHLRLVLRGWIGYVETVMLEWITQKAPDAVAVRDLLIDSLLALVRVTTEPISGRW